MFMQKSLHRLKTLKSTRTNAFMKSFKNAKELVVAFLNGEKEGYAGANRVLSNTRIIDNQIIHYSTPILERSDSLFILNVSRYSIQTKRLQQMIFELLKNNNVVTVSDVEMDYRGSLVAFLNQK